MLKDNNMEEFDLRVREILDSAEVKAPRSARRAVFAQLAPAHPAGGWGVPVFAFAAAAIAALLLIGKPSSDIDYSGSDESLVALVQSPKTDNPLLAEVFEPELMEEISTYSSSRFIPTKPVVEQEEQKNSSSKETSASGNSEKKSSTVQQVEPKFEAFDIWEDIDPSERQVASHKLSLLAGGNIASNDNRFAPAAHASSFASGFVPSGIREDSESSYGLPLSLGIEARYNITDKLGIGAGLQWNMLTRSFEGGYDALNGEITHTAHYVGVPVNFYFNIFATKSYMLYVKAGGAAEKCISSKYYMRSQGADAICKDATGALQLSAGAGFGLGFRLKERVWLYIDPSLQYFMPSEQPKSIRTDNPLVFNIQGGIRFNL